MIHHVFANKSNIGDWLSAMGIQSLLADKKITDHLCDEPFVEGTIATLKHATPSDAILIGGGGLFMDYFAPFWRGLAEIDPRVPLFIWGVGYCDLKDEPSRPPLDLLGPIIDRAVMCAVRDDLTRRLLERPSLPEPAGCPSLCVIAPRSGEKFGLLHVDNYTTVGVAAYDAMTAVGEAFAASTGRPYRTTNNRIRDGSAREMDGLLMRYAKSDLVLSSALHGCIIGVGMGKKVLAVSGDYKIEQFMQLVGLREWVLTQQEALDANFLKRRLEDLTQQTIAPDALDDLRRRQQAIGRQVKERIAQHVGK